MHRRSARKNERASRPGSRLAVRGFTLVELLVVIAIIGSVGAMGASLFRRSIAGNNGPAFARSVISSIHEARHAALTSGRAARIRIVPGNPMQIVSEVLDPTDVTKSVWLPSGTMNAPSLMQFCQPTAAVSLVVAVPTCPITGSMNTILCFAGNGRVNLTTTATACPGTGSAAASQPSSGTGATLYFRGTRNQGYDVKYKLLIWGLTGLPRLVDTW